MISPHFEFTFRSHWNSLIAKNTRCFSSHDPLALNPVSYSHWNYRLLVYKTLNTWNFQPYLTHLHFLPFLFTFHRPLFPNSYSMYSMLILLICNSFLLKTYYHSLRLFLNTFTLYYPQFRRFSKKKMCCDLWYSRFSVHVIVWKKTMIMR